MATPTDLEQAYRQCHYRVETPTGFVLLRVGQATTALESLPDNSGRASAAVMTAANPFSRRLSALENAERHECLLARLSAAGHRWLPARNEDPRGEWPDEPGVLAWGLSREEALDLARDFEQYAILWCESGKPAQLLWTGARPSSAAADFDEQRADDGGKA